MLRSDVLFPVQPDTIVNGPPSVIDELTEMSLRANIPSAPPRLTDAFTEMLLSASKVKACVLVESIGLAMVRSPPYPVPPVVIVMSVPFRLETRSDVRIVVP